MISRSEVVHARLSFVKGIPDTALSKSQHPLYFHSRLHDSYDFCGVGVREGFTKEVSHRAHSHVIYAQ